MVRTIDEVMHFMSNYTLAWHHWLMVLALVKLGGSATKAQIFPVYKKEGFSPHAIHDVFRNDLMDLGEAITIEGSLDEISDSTLIRLTDDSRFRGFVKKNLKTVVSTLKTRK